MRRSKGEHVYAMHAARPLSPPSHGAAELLLGMFTMAAPAVFAFRTPGTVAAALIGAALIGMAMTLTDPRGGGEPAHRNFDTIFGLLVALVSVALAFTGDIAATVYFAALVATTAALA